MEWPCRETCMTEAEWDRCWDVERMLAHLGTGATDRLVRLLAVACCRQSWGLLGDRMSREAVQVAERFADGLASEQELALARSAADEAVQDAKHAAWEAEADANFCDTKEYRESLDQLSAAHAARAAVSRNAREPDGMSDGWDVRPQGEPRFGPVARASWNLLNANSAELARCIFGNPFRPATLEPDWLTWNGGAVAKLAQTIYDDGAFHQLPALADALEEAGCTNSPILEHCRQPGAHPRGCWVVDLILGKG